MHYQIRKAQPHEWSMAEQVAEAAFGDYEAGHGDWFRTLRDAHPMRVLAESAEVLVAVAGDEIVGAVGYMRPGIPRHEFFPLDWAILRMLSVPPRHRGNGIARALVQACIECARRDQATILGLYTSPIMKAAIPLYLSIGFVHQRVLAPELGVPCDLYSLRVG